jgi:hypothetical protein
MHALGFGPCVLLFEPAGEVCSDRPQQQPDARGPGAVLLGVALHSGAVGPAEAAPISTQTTWRARREGSSTASRALERCRWVEVQGRHGAWT